MPGDVHLTTPLIWMCTAILCLLDGGLIIAAWRFISPVSFRQFGWTLIIISGVFFLLVWTSVILWAWDWFYVYIFPPWARYALPLLFAIGYGLLALGMGWLSLKLPFNPAITWCILGGLEGLFSHLYAIYALGAVSKPPIMHGTDPFAVLIFAIFEKAFYWSLILLACNFLYSRLFPRKILRFQ